MVCVDGQDMTHVFWVIETKSDHIVGSTHTSETAKAMATLHDVSTHFQSHICQTEMTEDHTHQDVVLTLAVPVSVQPLEPGQGA